MKTELKVPVYMERKTSKKGKEYLALYADFQGKQVFLGFVSREVEFELYKKGIKA